MKHNVLSFLTFVLLVAVVIVGASVVLSQDVPTEPQPAFAFDTAFDLNLCGSYCPQFSGAKNPNLNKADFVRVSLAEVVRGVGVDVTLCGSYCPNLQPFLGQVARQLAANVSAARGG